MLTAAVATALSIYVAGHPFIPQDAEVERDVQSTNWGPIALSFPFFSWIGDAKGFVFEVVIFAAILLFNRRAWIFAAGAVLSGGWYVLVSHLINRPRPTPSQVLRVTEHPGASSYPSGHTIFIVTVTVVLLLCLGYRFLPRWGRLAGWVVVAFLVTTNAVGRMYTGAHWPTDVLGGTLIAVAWLSFVMSIRWISDPVLEQAPRSTAEKAVRPAA